MTDTTTSLLSPLRPYLIRAWHEWMMDNGLTPHLQVKVDNLVNVPLAFVKDGVIVLNISTEATGHLHLGNDKISFQARFSGRVHDISVPVTHVSAIFARENGQGMVFDADEFIDEDNAPTEAEKPSASLSLVNKPTSTQTSSHHDDEKPPTPPKRTGGGLRIVK